MISFPPMSADSFDYPGLLQAARGQWGRIHEGRQRQIWNDCQDALAATGESLERPRF